MMTHENLINEAKIWSHNAHDSIGQMRKYGGKAYWVHTDAVSQLLKETGESEEVQIAGMLHDVVEDVTPNNPTYSVEEIKSKFGETVVRLVLEVTNVYEKKHYPHLNRTKRKQLERERLGKISKEGKSIKLADIINNVEGVVDQDAGFGRVFVLEKSVLLPLLKEGNPILYKKANEVIMNEINKLNNL
jgi:(p)ppGpp synthase/HD superfamily hydrolase